MILGSVNANREAIIQIAVLGDRKQVKSVRPVIDTGYTGDLMLPREIGKYGGMVKITALL
jgi:predicted aspartyl protease